MKRNRSFTVLSATHVLIVLLSNVSIRTQNTVESLSPISDVDNRHILEVFSSCELVLRHYIYSRAEESITTQSPSSVAKHPRFASALPPIRSRIRGCTPGHVLYDEHPLWSDGEADGTDRAADNDGILDIRPGVRSRDGKRSRGTSE